MVNPIRYGVIGTSWITDTFIEGAAATGKLRLVAVYSRTAERAQAYAARYGVSRTFTNLAEMACSAEIDAVYIASPNALHVEQSRLFLEHGKHVICEKPLAAHPEEVAALQELAAQKSVVYMEAIMYRHQPQRAILEQALASIGNITLARLDFSQLSSKYPAYLRGECPNIFNPALETGALMDLGIYCVYSALALFGYPTRIQAAATFLTTGADGSGSAVLQYPDKQVVLTYSKTGQTAVPSEFQGDRGTVTVASISKLEDIRRIDADGTVQLWGSAEKPVLMGHEANSFARYIADPAGSRGEYEENSRLAREVARCMAEIRRLAGIRFPSDPILKSD